MAKGQVISPELKLEIAGYADTHTAAQTQKKFKVGASTVARARALGFEKELNKKLNGNGAHPSASENVKSKPKYHLSFVDGQYRYAGLLINVMDPYNADQIIQRFNEAR